MTSRIARVVILAEDLRSARFLRHYVKRARHTGEIRLKVTERGSGEQWVRRRYPLEVREQRRRVHGRNRNAALLVHTDADLRSVRDRLRELEDALAGAGEPPRDAKEQIAVVIPKRHTETWLYGLCGESVDEEYDCKRDPERRYDGKVDGRLKDAAMKLFDLTRPKAAPPPEHLPSLRAAIPELLRL